MVLLMGMKKKLSITILTLFPEFIESYTRFGIIQKAIKNGILKFTATQLRSFGLDQRGTVDGRPYGGGVGMVLRPDVLYKAIASIRAKNKSKKTKVILLTPQGKPFNQRAAKQFMAYDHLVFVCGRYEGFDERARKFVDAEFSVGDYILMGGELPALVMSEAVLRLVPGVIGKLESTNAESFSDGLLEYPQYTKPEVLVTSGKSLRVPKVLLSGHHDKINMWRAQQAKVRTHKRRPDLLSI